MKPMTLYVSIVVAGVSVCGLLVLRHAYRMAPLMPATSDLPPPPRHPRPAVDHAGDSVRLGARQGGAADRTVTECSMAKLRREEARQRPWEGRN